MKARIQPLIGKYHGTIIELSDDGLCRDAINVWYSDGSPSQRQLEKYGLKPGDQGSEAWNDLFSDNHYETERGHLLAQIIVGAINAHAGVLEWLQINSPLKPGTTEIKHK